MLDMTLKTTVLLLITTFTTLNAWAENITPAPTPTAPPPATMTAIAAAPSPASVARSAFTTAITAHEPDSQLARISAGKTVHYFTELVGLQGHVITHRWEKDGVFQLGLQFPVGGQRWRVHSSKTITPNLSGIWTVTVQNDDGTTLKQDTLVVDPVMHSDTTLPAAIPVTPTLTTPAPAIPAPAQPLTEIPPEVQKESTTHPASAMPETASEKSPQAIWDTLPR